MTNSPDYRAKWNCVVSEIFSFTPVLQPGDKETQGRKKKPFSFCNKAAASPGWSTGENEKKLVSLLLSHPRSRRSSLIHVNHPMSASPSYVTKWKWCALVSLAMVLLSLIPQIHLWIVRGRDWNGAYVSSQTDEPLYSAYVNALINGRARKNDPFGGKDDSSDAPLPESIFSIQFVPAYAVALPARILGSSAATAFIVLIATAALLASLSVFWLLKNITGDHRLAATGTLFVLCLGGVVGSFGLFGTIIDIPFPVLPFLRRYQPAVAFPLFFIFQLLVWRALTGHSKRGARVSAAVAGVTLTALIFSYLYLWTTAVAWLACIGALRLFFQPADRRKILAVLTTISAITAIALLFYVYLLSHQTATLDGQLILTSTHRPDLLRVHEILGAAILVALAIGIWRRRIDPTDPHVIYAASLALLPFIVFNQQILTGRTIQVFHFENYVVNYSTTLGLFLAIVLFWRPVSRRLLFWVAALSLTWGVIAVGLPARLDSVPTAIARDKSVPVFVRLKELATEDGTVADLRTKGQTSTLVYSPDVSLTKWLPTWTSQGTLLDQTGVHTGTATPEQQKKFFYMHLYYSKVEIETLRQALNDKLDPTPRELVSAPSVMIGHARLFPQLSSQFQPIQSDEIEREVQVYQTYAASFSREEALKRPITYAVIPNEGNFDFTNLDRWYERDAGERVGAYTLYRLKLRN
jgi:hypothetical protein